MNRAKLAWAGAITASVGLAMNMLTLTGSAEAGIYSQVVQADDPVAYWRLGESSTLQTAVNSATGPSSAGAAASGSYTAGVGVGTTGLIFGDPTLPLPSPTELPIAWPPVGLKS